jgi:hypothetical protein
VFSRFQKKLDILISVASLFRKFENVLRVAFLIPSGTLSLVKYPVLIKPNIETDHKITPQLIHIFLIRNRISTNHTSN